MDWRVLEPLQDDVVQAVGSAVLPCIGVDLAVEQNAGDGNAAETNGGSSGRRISWYYISSLLIAFTLSS